MSHVEHATTFDYEISIAVQDIAKLIREEFVEDPIERIINVGVQPSSTLPK